MKPYSGLICFLVLTASVQGDVLGHLFSDSSKEQEAPVEAPPTEAQDVVSDPVELGEEIPEKLNAVQEQETELEGLRKQLSSLEAKVEAAASTGSVDALRQEQGTLHIQLQELQQQQDAFLQDLKQLEASLQRMESAVNAMGETQQSLEAQLSEAAKAATEPLDEEKIHIYPSSGKLLSRGILLFGFFAMLLFSGLQLKQGRPASAPFWKLPGWIALISVSLSMLAAGLAPLPTLIGLLILSAVGGCMLGAAEAKPEED